jgi:hypothetical protein
VPLSFLPGSTRIQTLGLAVKNGERIIQKRDRDELLRQLSREIA